MHSRHNIEKLTSWIRIYSDLLYRSGKNLKNSWICNSSICMLLSYLSRCALLWGKMMILTAFKNHDVNLHEIWCYPPILEVIHGWCRLLVAAMTSTNDQWRASDTAAKESTGSRTYTKRTRRQIETNTDRTAYQIRHPCPPSQNSNSSNASSTNLRELEDLLEPRG